MIAGEDAAQDGDLPVSPAVLGSVLQPGQRRAHRRRPRPASRRASRARPGPLRRSLVGGVVASHKGVNLPGVPLPIPSLTRKDLDDLEFALELGVDYVALSFVRSASDVRALRTLIEARGSHAWVIAKIEKAEAIAALDEILAEADGVMVARGDLGVEIGAAEVPLLQKRIILRALERGEARDHRDADARVDDPLSPSRPGRRRPTSRTRSSTAPRRSCSRARPPSASTRSRRSR